MKRIPTLDGWRGIAILLVLIDHFTPGFPSHWGNPWMELIGLHGVTIFFVLSGFLITSRLLAEKRINLGQFYIRRFFRLMPCAWTYLVIVGIVGGLTIPDLTACVFFYRNQVNFPFHAATGHFWSLSAEEDFYLAWPGILLLLGRRAWIFAAVSVIGLTFWSHYPSAACDFAMRFHQQPLMVGCILAFLPKATFRGHSWALLISLIGLVFCIRFSHYQIVAPMPEVCLIAFAIWSTSHHRFPFADFVLENRYLATIGSISYSLYMWQMPLSMFGPRNWFAVPFRFAALLVLGWSSYRLLERPMIQFGRRFQVRTRRGANEICGDSPAGVPEPENI